MTRIGAGYDWGRRSPRWAGVTSQVALVGGTRVHYLRAGDAASGPTHLLVHAMGTGAWSWMDVIGPLSARGPVIAPDLPGSGRSRPVHRGRGGVFAAARFVDDFTTALGIERMIVHGHSMGGLVGGVFAGRAPDRVERLVLTSAPLPGLPDPPRFAAAWRVGLEAARPVADVLVGAGLRLKASAWARLVEERDSSRLGSEVSRMSPELLSLAAEEIGRLVLRWRVEGAVDAAIDVLRALTVDEARTRDALDSIAAPTLLLWGAEDRVIPRRLISEVEAAHPGWSSRTVDGVGHLLPWESPGLYVELAGSGRTLRTHPSHCDGHAVSSAQNGDLGTAEGRGITSDLGLTGTATRPGMPFGSRQPRARRRILTASGTLRHAAGAWIAGPARRCPAGGVRTSSRGAAARDAGRSDGATSWEEHLMEAPSRQEASSRQRPRHRPNWTYRRRGFSNLLRMGHCAPTAMQTILDVSSADKEWLVRLSAGMPGGIGNTGHECGAVTSPLAVMGTAYGLREVDRGLPVIFDRGHALCRDFLACQGTLQCREIRTKEGFPRQCVGPVLRSAELWRDALDRARPDAIPESTRAGYSKLYAHFAENDFHCAQAVFGHLGYSPAEHPELFDATSAFLGGMLFLGRTCSALTAGVMAIGLKDGEIEDSRLRVIRLLAVMTVGGDAFGDHLNKFNASMNRGNRLAKWFAGEFGSTQCHKITGCDFATPEGVSRYVEGDRIAACRALGCRVAEQVERMLAAGAPA